MALRPPLPVLLLGLLASLAGWPAAANELGLPLACVPGETCWLVRYLDHDPGPGFADYRCGGLGADGHNGTDFALADPRAMQAGVPVLAAAGGVVRSVRDGVPDQPEDGSTGYDPGPRTCGNGVLVDHGDGWQTQYCHLRQGSIAVRPGASVARGQPLGLVGMSGEANFPHLHLTVRRADVVLDPFTGTSGEEGCHAAPATSLWQPEVARSLAYVAVPIAVVGLADHLPGHAEIVRGTAGAATLRQDSAALVAYSLAYGIAQGDRIELAITGPDGGEVHRAAFTAEQDAPRATRSAGLRRPGGGWPPGTYRAEITVRRGGQAWSRSALRQLD